MTAKWTTPEFQEIPLAMEVKGYVNADDATRPASPAPAPENAPVARADP
jgi:coenzyme PQQ precursor peptide PqqA